jgi:hypothetical protein
VLCCVVLRNAGVEARWHLTFDGSLARRTRLGLAPHVSSSLGICEGNPSQRQRDAVVLQSTRLGFQFVIQHWSYQDSSGLTSVARRRLRGTWRCTPPLHLFSFGSNAIELAMSMPHTDGDSELSDPLSLVWTAWEDPYCGSTWIHAVIASYHAYLIPGIQFRHPSHPSLTLLSQALLSLFNPLSLH